MCVMLKSQRSRVVDESMMVLLSRLLLARSEAGKALMLPAPNELAGMSHDDFESLVALASSNHVVVRGLEIVSGILLAAHERGRADWAAAAVETERARIAKAVERLGAICSAFDREGLDVTVIKSLDHWPDLGNDLDLYTNASGARVCELMRRRFGAKIAPRSWGDRLACKWNFNLPGLPEAVEIHAGRLGQTGEHVGFASRIPRRARVVERGGRGFPVASPTDRLMVSTLQRMYRHFYFRLCDIVDSSELIASGAVDYDDLQRTALQAGIWEGVATYLVIVSDYVRQYRGTDLGLPAMVSRSARFGGSLVYFSGDFLRIPILPQSARLYRMQLAGMLRRRELHSSARLGLLPWLATAAAVGQKITGSDKGIW